MKKMLALLWALSVIFYLNSFTVAFADETVDTDFEITDSGEITAYYGGEWVVVPEQIDSIPVIKIGEQAFFDLGISDVYLPERLSVIGKSAFEGSAIESVDIQSGVIIIGERAFANCPNLYTVFVDFDENTVIGKEAFYGTNYLLFYVNCDVNIDEFSKKIFEAKGDQNYEFTICHVASDYDEQGNVLCSECGYLETPTMELLPFEDIPVDAWYYDYVQNAYSNQIINRKSETIFDPEAGMTCAEAAKIAACINAIFFEPL